ncbi:hypothetical protein BU25DRAFT_185345 [Macroventuria anomochaeta]|uniref:Uncharacterized protein n=1 Tax=Macroventuria anomochaeta TaxID=301207 RepID=A0ACB6SAS4_9PLEO|nr:uncharacterized protein BU25DRAFT_185345 [Macroventuria anomochaeta]KAF2631395.1 hypothetical protein BU25DRAFT_185345 [Macroventuria anomochaeta]
MVHFNNEVEMLPNMTLPPHGRVSQTACRPAWTSVGNHYRFFLSNRGTGMMAESSSRSSSVTSLPAIRTAPRAEQNHRHFDLERVLLPPHLSNCYALIAIVCCRQVTRVHTFTTNNTATLMVPRLFHKVPSFAAKHTPPSTAAPRQSCCS